MSTLWSAYARFLLLVTCCKLLLFLHLKLKLLSQIKMATSSSFEEEYKCKKIHFLVYWAFIANYVISCSILLIGLSVACIVYVGLWSMMRTIVISAPRSYIHIDIYFRICHMPNEPDERHPINQQILVNFGELSLYNIFRYNVGNIYIL